VVARRSLQVLLLPPLALVASLSMTYVLWRDAQGSVYKELQSGIRFRTLEVAERVRRRATGYDQVLHALRG
jgi:hypothetical protein